MSLRLTDIRQPLNDLEVESLTYASPNIRLLDLSGSSKIKNTMICKIVKELQDLETFICLRNPLINNDVLQTLAINCK